MAERRQKGTGSVWKDKNKNIYHGEMQIGYLPNGNKKNASCVRQNCKRG